MDIQKYIDSKKKLSENLIEFIDSPENDEDDEFFKLLDEFKLGKNKDELKLFIKLLIIVSDHHYRAQGFFTKIEQIIIHIENEIKQNFSNFEIYHLFRANRRIVLFLLEQNIIHIDSEIIESIKDNSRYLCYFYPEIKSFIDENKIKNIESLFEFKYVNALEDFDQKRHEGENDSYLCKLIREDSVKEFIIYVNQANIPLSSNISNSLFETNKFLHRRKNTLSLIEYAAFFGAIEIFNYLRMSGVDLTFPIWAFAAHSRNAQLIYILEENHVSYANHKPKVRTNKPQDKHIFDFQYFSDDEDDEVDFQNYRNSLGYNEKINYNDDFELILISSLKYHHYEITNYFFDRLKSDDGKISPQIFNYCIKHQFFTYFPSEMDDLYSKGIYYFCKYDYKSIIDILLASLNKFNSEDASKSCLIYRNKRLLQYFIDKRIIEINKLQGCKWIKEINIPQFVHNIGKKTFFGCCSLTRMILPPSIKKIGSDSFSGCTSLVEISIPSSVRSIDPCAFSYCYSLKEVKIPSLVTSINSYVFYKCTSLKKVTISGGITSIGTSAFEGCTSLEQINITKFIETIDSKAFYECTSLKVITFDSHSTLKKINMKSFMGCSSLIDLQLPDSVNFIGDYAFCGCLSLVNVQMPSSLKYIQPYAFSQCKSLQSVSIPPSIQIIKLGLFKGCHSLKSITIPECVKGIESSVFKECPLMTKDMIPSSVIYIDQYAFEEQIAN